MKKTTSGFTIVELLIVIVVIAILTTISFITYNGIKHRAVDSAVDSNVTTVLRKMAEYGVEKGNTPVYLFGYALHNSDDGTYDFPLPTPERLSKLQQAGIPASIIRHPDAPNGVFNSFVHVTDSTGERLLDENNLSATFEIINFPTLKGFSSINEAVDKIGEAYNAHDISAAEEAWIQANPWPVQAEGQDNNEYEREMIPHYKSYYNYIKSLVDPSYADAFDAYNTYLDFSLAYSEGGGRLSVPMTSFYFFELLGNGALPGDQCTSYNVEHMENWNSPLGEDGISCYNSGTEELTVPTGVRIYYYSHGAKKWKSKQHGSGEPYTRFRNRAS